MLPRNVHSGSEKSGFVVPAPATAIPDELVAGCPALMMVAGKHINILPIKAEAAPALTRTETPGGANRLVVKLPSATAVV
jgi:hypothetical protein